MTPTRSATRPWHRRFSGADVANNNYGRDLAQQTLADGTTDLISLGRPFIVNPDLVDRLRTGALLAEAPKRYWHGGSAVSYSDWLGMPMP